MTCFTEGQPGSERPSCFYHFLKLFQLKTFSIPTGHMLLSHDLYPVWLKLCCVSAAVLLSYLATTTPVIAEMPGCLIILLVEKILDYRMPCYSLICKQYIFSSVQVFLMKYIQTYTKRSSRCLSDIQMSLFFCVFCFFVFYLLDPRTKIAIRL